MLLPVNFGLRPEYIRTSSLDLCMMNRISRYESKISEMDAFLFNEHSENKYYPFVGNGYFGVSLDQNKIYLNENRSASLETAFSPIFLTTISGYLHNENIILDLTSGSLVKLQCFKQTSLCVSITSTSFVHRTRSNLLTQEIKIHNPTKAAVQIELKDEQEMATDQIKSISSIKINNIEYKILMQQLKTNSSKTAITSDGFQSVLIVLFARPVLPKFLNVPISSDKVYTIVSGVHHEYIPFKTESDFKIQLDNVTNTFVASMQASVNTDAGILLSEHEQAWKSLWKTGISIDRSLAPGALNGHHINSTLYYLLSNYPAFIDLHGTSDGERRKYQKYLFETSHCFNGHDTMYITNLWSTVNTHLELVTLVNQWLILLHKYGCGRLIKAGAHGLVLAVIYSAGSFNFVGDHMSFGMHPQDLQRKLHFRNMMYKNPLFPRFNVFVDLDKENRPQLWVSMASPKGILYACDAGCVDEPIRLSSTFQWLPIKMTKPRYPILYISDELLHIRDLKHVIHVVSIEDARAHNHHIIAMHKHGHSWAGLPPLFWIFIVLLVLIFHLFLCKVIYNEYCRYKDDYDLSINSLAGSRESGRSSFHYVPSTRRTHYFGDLH